MILFYIIIIQDDTVYGKNNVNNLLVYVNTITFNIQRDGHNTHKVCAASIPQLSGLPSGLYQEAPIKLH